MNDVVLGTPVADGALVGATGDEMRAIGRGLGYPECCIEAFIADVFATPMRSPGRARGGIEGYVPCAQCAAIPAVAVALRVAEGGRRKRAVE